MNDGDARDAEREEAVRRESEQRARWRLFHRVEEDGAPPWEEEDEDE